MKIKRSILPFLTSLLALGGIFAGLGMARVFGSGDSTSSRLLDPLALPSPTPVPGPTSTEVPTATPGHLPRPSPTPDATAIARDEFFDRVRMSSLTAGWKTDFTRHSVPFSEILSGGVPRDGIPPIYSPKHTTIEKADAWIKGQEPVIALEVNGDARAYPIQILIWHEIVNDVIGGVPVAVTFCPLCNSAIVFDRRLDGVTYDFGVSGNLRNSDLIMWDHQTESWWQQFTGEAIVGELTGRQPTMIPATIISWADFKAASPEATVLSRDTGLRAPYGRNPYVGYDRADNPPFLFDGDTDGRLLPKERVAALVIGDTSAAFPFSVLEKERVVNYNIAGQDTVVFFKPGAVSALDGSSIQQSRDVGATGVFDPNVNSQTLTFRPDGDNTVDNETGSQWNILGEATQGSLKGSKLTPIIHANHFWFAWGAFKPDTKIYRGAD